MAKQEIITLRNGEEIRLSEREKLFSEYYLADGNRNATQAAIKAGLSEKTARSQGQRMLTNVDIQKFIHNKTAPILEALGITQDRIMTEWAQLALSRPDVVIMKDTPTPMGYDIKHRFKTITIDGVDMDSHETEIDFKTANKIKALTVIWGIRS